MSTQFFIVHSPAIVVNTRESTITSPGLQFQCGTCPARVFVQQLTNLLPLLEHARQHEPKAVGGYAVSALSPSETVFGSTAGRRPQTFGERTLPVECSIDERS